MRMLGHIFPQLLNVLIILIYDDLLKKVIANINFLRDRFDLKWLEIRNVNKYLCYDINELENFL